MSKPAIIASAVILGVLIGGAAFLAGWDIPPPSAKVEKTLPDDRFPK